MRKSILFLLILAAATIFDNAARAQSVNVCVGSTVTLSDSVAGGVWTSSNTSVATVSSAGVVTGISAGTDTVTYTVGSDIVQTLVSVKPLPVFTIITPDTAICIGSAFTIRVKGIDSAIYNWTLGKGFSSTSVMDPVASPTVTATDTLTVTYPGGACPYTQTITITVDNPDFTILTSDTVIYEGTSFELKLNGNPACSYNWTPDYGLSSSSVMDPIDSPSITITYFVTSTYPGTTCTSTEAITVVVIPPTGYTTLQGNKEPTVYPNPTSEMLTIKMDNTSYNSFTIRNTVGEIVLQQQINAAQIDVNVKSLPAGGYYVTLKGDGGVKVEQFVKE